MVTKEKNKGITLIALVITIIILLLLAGISIQAITNTGLFGKARQAVQESKYASAAEKVALAVNASYDEKGKLNDEYLKENVNKIEGLSKKIDTVTYDLKIVVDGFEFTISEYGKITGEKKEVATLPDNTPKTDAGTNVKVPDGWNSQNVRYTKTTDGTEVTTLETVATVYAVSDGQNNTVPVPNGFYYVGGNKNSGVVISDDERDKNKFEGQADVPAGAVYNLDGTVKTENLSSEEQAQTLFGNQFVWIPCTVEEYKKCDVWEGITTFQNANWETKTNTAEKVQIEKYGGFYIGRYEAGTSSLTSSKIDFSKGYSATSDWTNTNFNADFITSGKITSKAGEIPYYHSDYETAVKLTEEMYKNDNERNKSVTSGLVTGTMWDVTLNYFKTHDNTLNLINKQWGNCSNTILTNCKGRYLTVSGNGITSDAVKNTDGVRHYGIMTTASSEDAKKNNIYDMAGNLWEWTQEIAYINTTESYILRGGSFLQDFSSYPVCYRAFLYTGNSHTHNGFRTVLYIK